MDMGPLNRLVGLLNLFLEIAGLPRIPDLGNLGDDAEAAFAPLDAVIGSSRSRLSVHAFLGGEICRTRFGRRVLSGRSGGGRQADGDPEISLIEHKGNPG